VLIRPSLNLTAILLAVAVGIAPVQAADAVSIPRVGVLLVNESSRNIVKEVLHELGYVEGKNIHLEWRVAPGGYAQLHDLANELMKSTVDIVLTGGDAATQAALQATESTPIVFTSGDPIIGGYVRSLSHPGSNATGIYVASAELEAKRLELLLEMVPKARRIAYLRNPAHPHAEHQVEYARAAARKHGVQLTVFDVQTADQVDAALRRISRKVADGAMVSTDVVLAGKSKEIANALRNARLPTAYPWRTYVDHGGLMYYGVDVHNMWRRVFSYVDRLLKGAKPTDLPVEQVSSFELVISRGSARALGLDVPQSIIARANELAP
jgi:putative ABC transport system substrate-binding protein